MGSSGRSSERLRLWGTLACSRTFERSSDANQRAQTDLDASRFLSFGQDCQASAATGVIDRHQVMAIGGNADRDPGRLARSGLVWERP